MTSLWTPGLGRYLARHPSSALTLARAGWRLRRNGWWRQAPFLPLPDAKYWRFRLMTLNGAAGAELTPRAMVVAAEWSLRQPVRR